MTTGHDVTATVATLGRQTISITSDVGSTRAWTRDHFVEVELPETASTDKTLMADCERLAASFGLVGQRLPWVRGGDVKPKWLESRGAPTGRGGWRVAQAETWASPAGRKQDLP